MRILGLDLGEVTLGIALSNSDETVASMIETFRFPKDDYDQAFEKIIKTVQDYNVKEIALGYPLNMNGTVGYKAELSEELKGALDDYYQGSVKTVLVDERLTSVMANKIMIGLDVSRNKRKQKVDSMAAMEILQSYLDSKRIKNGR